MKYQVQEVRYTDPFSILAVNGRGQLRLLYCPFRVTCTQEVEGIRAGTSVYVSEVWKHPDYCLVYLIYDRFYPFHCFTLQVPF